jgi:hypothetical protein
MIIHLSPVRDDHRYTLARSGDVLTLDGVAFDFGALAEGEALVPEGDGSRWFAGPVTRQDGRIIVTLILPHGSNAPPETRFPAALDLTADGPVPLPPFNQPDPEAPA